MRSPSTILMTGATGKLGRKLAIGFSEQGARLILPSRTLSRGNDLKLACMEAGAKEVILLPIDLISEQSAKELGAELERRALYPDSLINNARNMDYLALNDDGSVGRNNWSGELLLDVIVPYELTMVLGKMPNTELKKIVNIASIYGVTASNLALYGDAEPPPINYGVAKAALIHLTKELAVRLAKKGIAVNAVSFGGVAGRVDEKFQTAYAGLCPAGRMLSEDDVLGPVKFLLSDESKGMTGHNLVVDGGWTVW